MEKVFGYLKSRQNLQQRWCMIFSDKIIGEKGKTCDVLYYNGESIEILNFTLQNSWYFRKKTRQYILWVTKFDFVTFDQFFQAHFSQF